ncbi:MAG: YeeE/YedE thiosulfate transporter family protein [Planctomycetota bacterium]
MDAGTILLNLTLGIAFGFALERAGFGDARKLAAQFYLRDQSVLKVMFTAIVWCALLLFWSSALGWIDFERIFVPPTYLASAIAGGLLVGTGFIIGGYCPGTSLVAAASGKLDGLFFLGGIAAGSLAFFEALSAFAAFYDSAGYLGRVTLFDRLGVDSGMAVFAAILLALGMFAGAEAIERALGGRGAGRKRRFEAAGALLLLALGGALALRGGPSVEARARRLSAELERKVASREFAVDPAELLELRHNRLVRLQVFDVRAEADYNLFHLFDAVRLEPSKIDASAARRIPAGAVVVLVSNDEAAAVRAWMRFAALGVPNAYWLAGGVNLWLDVHREGRADAGPAPDGPDVLRHRFDRALGGSWPFSDPDPARAPKRAFERRVRSVAASAAPKGGCGG